MRIPRRRGALAGALALVMAVSALPRTEAFASSSSSSGQLVFSLRWSHDSRDALQPDNDIDFPTKYIVRGRWTDARYQQWTFTAGGTNTVQIRNVRDERCLTAYGDDGVFLLPCGPTDQDQQWWFRPANIGYWIYSPHRRQCMEMVSGYVFTGMALRDCKLIPNQVWMPVWQPELSAAAGS